MKANEFVREFGLKAAKLAILSAPSENDRVWYFYWCRGCGHGGSSCDMLTNDWFPDYCACPKCSSENLQCDDWDLDNLKRLVESWELVESYGGLDDARDFVFKNTGLYDVRDLKQAINLVESCQ